MRVFFVDDTIVTSHHEPFKLQKHLSELHTRRDMVGPHAPCQAFPQ